MFVTRLKRNESSSSVQNYFHLDSLQKKLKDLEEENVVLRSEVKLLPMYVLFFAKLQLCFPLTLETNAVLIIIK